MLESISCTPKRATPVVPMLSAVAEWSFDVGAGMEPWPWPRPPKPTTVLSTRKPKAGAGSGHVPVFAYTVTTGNHVHLESGLEHDLVRELDRNPDVNWIVAQPCRLRLPLKKARRRLEHTPDLLSTTTDGTVTIWDVRPEAEQDQEFLATADATATACSTFGWAYQTFACIPAIRRINAMWLHAYRRDMPWYDRSLRLLCDRLGPQMSIGQVLALDAGGGHVLSAMWHGIWAGQLVCDLDLPLKANTPLVMATPRAAHA